MKDLWWLWGKSQFTRTQFSNPCSFICRVNKRPLVTMRLISTIYKDSVPWPLFICTVNIWPLVTMRLNNTIYQDSVLWPLFIYTVNKWPLVTMRLITVIYKDSVLWPLFICTLINLMQHPHTHNLRSPAMLNRGFWTVPFVMMLNWLK